MEHAARVRVLERAADLDGDRRRLGEVEPPRRRAVDAPRQVASRHVLRDDVDRTLLVEHVEAR